MLTEVDNILTLGLTDLAFYAIVLKSEAFDIAKNSSHENFDRIIIIGDTKLNHSYRNGRQALKDTQFIGFKITDEDIGVNFEYAIPFITIITRRGETAGQPFLNVNLGAVFTGVIITIVGSLFSGFTRFLRGEKVFSSKTFFRSKKNKIPLGRNFDYDFDERIWETFNHMDEELMNIDIDVVSCSQRAMCDYIKSSLRSNESSHGFEKLIAGIINTKFVDRFINHKYLMNPIEVARSQSYCETSFSSCRLQKGNKNKIIRKIQRYVKPKKCTRAKRFGSKNPSFENFDRNVVIGDTQLDHSYRNGRQALKDTQFISFKITDDDLPVLFEFAVPFLSVPTRRGETGGQPFVNINLAAIFTGVIVTIIGSFIGGFTRFLRGEKLFSNKSFFRSKNKIPLGRNEDIGVLFEYAIPFITIITRRGETAGQPFLNVNLGAVFTGVIITIVGSLFSGFTRFLRGEKVFSSKTFFRSKKNKIPLGRNFDYDFDERIWETFNHMDEELMNIDIDVVSCSQRAMCDYIKSSLRSNESSHGFEKLIAGIIKNVVIGDTQLDHSYRNGRQALKDTQFISFKITDDDLPVLFEFAIPFLTVPTRRGETAGEPFVNINLAAIFTGVIVTVIGSFIGGFTRFLRGEKLFSNKSFFRSKNKIPLGRNYDYDFDERIWEMFNHMDEELMNIDIDVVSCSQRAMCDYIKNSLRNNESSHGFDKLIAGIINTKLVDRFINHKYLMNPIEVARSQSNCEISFSKCRLQEGNKNNIIRKIQQFVKPKNTTRGKRQTWFHNPTIMNSRVKDKL
ncbi:CLUMA_CG020390, isoform A [Clunio marinus]|uniref:CLUMA_CG020390, isoform A n=1 Tax=Clunio marinus TaxID=568069 RepID=A0A1J1J8W4_9DIPT|nr:CLUMA_CG020390, isoform A [Clunio marinus]